MKRIDYYAFVLSIGLCGCVSPYQTATLAMPIPLPDTAIDLVLSVVKVDYPQLNVDRAAFRIQSNWVPHEASDTACQRRLTLYVEEPAILHCMIEVRYLRGSMFGVPKWSAPEGHSQWEYATLDRIGKMLRDVDELSGR